MTYDARVRPHQINPTTGALAETLAVGTDGAVTFIDGSVPVLLLPAGSTAADVPADTPVGTIILLKA